MTRKSFPASNLTPEATPWGRAIQQEAADLRAIVDRLTNSAGLANAGAQSILASTASASANPVLTLTTATVVSADGFGLLLGVNGVTQRALNGNYADYVVGQVLYVLSAPSLSGPIIVNLPAAAPSPAAVGAIVGPMFTSGDVTGTYNATSNTVTLSLGAGVIVQADLSSTLQTYLMARANQTGTQTANTISDFANAVRAIRLDQMATPTATFSMGGQQVTGVPTPATSDAIASKGYVDASVGSGAADTGWITITGLSANWSGAAAYGFPVAAYRKVGNQLFFSGLLAKSTAITANETIFTLPVGYRPSVFTQFPGAQVGTGVYTFYVTTAGLFQVGTFAGAANNVSLMSSIIL